MKKHPKKISKVTEELFANADIPDVPVLLSKSRVHDSIAVAVGSFVMAGQHMRNAAASMNMGFKVKSRRGFKITKKVMRHARKWKRCKA